MYKLQAYADDLVFIIEDPIKSTPVLLKEIEQYGNVAGLKINKKKMKFIVKNMIKKTQKLLISLTGSK